MLKKKIPDALALIRHYCLISEGWKHTAYRIISSDPGKSSSGTNTGKEVLPVFTKSCREGEQEVGDNLNVCVLNILPKVSSLCDLMWPQVDHLIKRSCLEASYTKLSPSLVWCRYIFCRWRYVFYLSRDPTRPLLCNAMQFLAACHHPEKFGDHRYSDS